MEKLSPLIVTEPLGTGSVFSVVLLLFTHHVPIAFYIHFTTFVCHDVLEFAHFPVIARQVASFPLGLPSTNVISSFLCVQLHFTSPSRHLSLSGSAVFLSYLLQLSYHHVCLCHWLIGRAGVVSEMLDFVVKCEAGTVSRSVRDITYRHSKKVKGHRREHLGLLSL